MDSDEGDSNNCAGIYIYFVYKAYLRIYLKMRRCVFLCFQKVLI